MAVNWIKIYKQYKGMWVAFKQDEKTVIASGNTAKSVHDRAIQRGFENPILSFIPLTITPMVG